MEKIGNLTPRGPKTPEQIIRKIDLGDYAGDIYPVQNLVAIGFGIFSPKYKKMHFLEGVGVETTRYPLEALEGDTDFDAQYVKRRRFA